MRVAVIGLGNMGLPMAVNILKAGHDVAGYDMRVAPVADLAAGGGKSSETARAAVAGADVVLLMVVSGEQAEAVLFGADGVAEQLKADAIVVAACTQAPVAATELSNKLAARGITMLDAPVSGGVAGAMAATLTVMASGPKPAFERARPVFEAVGKNIFYLGELAGQGSTAKMINQLLCGVHLVAAAEAISVAERAGLVLPDIHQMISLSAGNSWMWGDRGPRMLQDEPEITSAIDIFVKDLAIVITNAGSAEDLPLSHAAYAKFASASQQGHGLADDSQVIRVYRTMNNS